MLNDDEEGACFWPTSNRPHDDDWTTVTGEDAEVIGELHRALNPRPKEAPAPEWNECNSDLR